MVKFSIITPTYNRLDSGFLLECIKSVYGQTGSNYAYEHIIVNDGSQDATADFLKSQAQRNPNLKIINQKNSGTALAVQNGIKNSTGDFIIIMGDDDLLPQNSISIRAEYIKNNPDIDWFYGKAKWIDGKGNNIDVQYQSQYFENFFYERMLIGNKVHGGTPTVKKECYLRIKWPQWLERSEDYFVWLDLLRPENKYKFGFLDEFVYIYRWHENMYTATYLNNQEKLGAKQKLNEKIRGLHPDNVVFLTEQIRKMGEEKEKQQELWRRSQEMQEKLVKKTKEQEKLIGLQHKKIEFLGEKAKSLSKEIDAAHSSKGWRILQHIERIPGLNKKFLP